MPRVALYARVSTTDQRPEIQVESLRSYARPEAWESWASTWTTASQVRRTAGPH